jgi:hypothetical protein
VKQTPELLANVKSSHRIFIGLLPRAALFDSSGVQGHVAAYLLRCMWLSAEAQQAKALNKVVKDVSRFLQFSAKGLGALVGSG